ncbi:methylated-DNA--[protein]-cysteine S-methyltransferase [Lutibacter sp.]|uniref:methylated-DNA--[protein]-cysteine S-methyltransferase n=1 Tax=Lutibacter sp. TaxID=1925666 RepID=UPI00356A7558
MESKETTYYKTPIGIAEIIGDEHGICEITILDEEVKIPKKIPKVLQDCIQQLDEYFEGKRTQFTVKLNPEGTEFQKKVWNELLNVPFGKTISYIEQSNNLGNTKAIRAVASANGRNPIWILIPCHRIIGKNGSLTGYAGGIWRKRWLLDHENPPAQQSLF